MIPVLFSRFDPPCRWKQVEEGRALDGCLWLDGACVYCGRDEPQEPEQEVAA